MFLHIRQRRDAGAFSIVVRDPLYPSQPLYDYDVGAACPPDFRVTFAVPTDAHDNYNTVTVPTDAHDDYNTVTVPTDAHDDYDKTLLVHVVDSYRTIKITVFRPAPNRTHQTHGYITLHYNTNSVYGGVSKNESARTTIAITTEPVTK